MRETFFLLGIVFQLGAAMAAEEIDYVSWFYYVGIFEPGLHKKRDPICIDYEKPAILDVCEEIFEKLRADDYPDLHTSNAAYSDLAPILECEKGAVTLIGVTDDSNTPPEIEQNMMPCRGRHEPLRTSVTVDDYYDTFYISSGLQPQTVMVYKLEKEPDRQWFRPLKYYQSIDAIAAEAVSKIPSMYNLRPELVPQVSRNDNQLEVETIYIREMVNKNVREKKPWVYKLEESIEKILEKRRSLIAEQWRGIPEPEDDPLNGINKWQLLDACKRVFDCAKYRYLRFTENIAMFSLWDPDKSNSLNEVESVAFLELKHYNISPFLQQSLYPCFGRTVDNPSKEYDKDELANRYRISYGPRPSSVIIYEKTTIPGWKGVTFYTPIELVENLNLGSLDPTPLDMKEIVGWIDDQLAIANKKQMMAPAPKKRTRKRGRPRQSKFVDRSSADVSKSVKTTGDASQSVKTAGGSSKSIQTAGGPSRSFKMAGGPSKSVQTAGGSSKSVQTAGGPRKSVRTASDVSMPVKIVDYKSGEEDTDDP